MKCGTSFKSTGHAKIKISLKEIGKRVKREKKLDVVRVIRLIWDVTTFKTLELMTHWSCQCCIIQLKYTNWWRILCITQVFFIASGLIHLHSLPAKKNYLHYNAIK